MAKCRYSPTARATHKLEELLKSPDYTLERFLDNEDVLYELRAGSTGFLQLYPSSGPINGRIASLTSGCAK